MNLNCDAYLRLKKEEIQVAFAYAAQTMGRDDQLAHFGKWLA